MTTLNLGLCKGFELPLKPFGFTRAAFSVFLALKGDERWVGKRFDIMLDDFSDNEPSAICYNSDEDNGQIALADGQVQRLYCLIATDLDPEPPTAADFAFARPQGIESFAVVTGTSAGADSDNAFMSGELCYDLEGREECCDNADEVFNNPGDDFKLGTRDVYRKLGSCNTFEVPRSAALAGNVTFALSHRGSDPWSGPRLEVYLDSNPGLAAIACVSRDVNGDIQLSRDVTEKLLCFLGPNI